MNARQRRKFHREIIKLIETMSPDEFNTTLLKENVSLQKENQSLKEKIGKLEELLHD